MGHYDFLKNMHHEQIADLLGNFRAAFKRGDVQSQRDDGANLPIANCGDLAHAFRPAPHCLREIVRVDAAAPRRKFCGLLRDPSPRLIGEVPAQNLADAIHLYSGSGEALLVDGLSSL
jgi:hypothetical protein